MLKSKTVTIPHAGAGERPNRDAGKTYLLTEMPAFQAERWARHAIAATHRSDLNVNEEIAKLGMLGFYLVGFQALAGGDIHAVDALMDEMLGCIKIQESRDVVRPIGAQGDIWEVATLYQLRKELLELHMGFTFAELVPKLTATRPAAQTSQTTSTSQESSAP